MMKVAVLCVCVAMAMAHPEFRDAIPNGYAVPNPCGDGVWGPVGHFDPETPTAAKNQFGKDFLAAGSWTADLCALDSDGDGVSNGEELGDPDCAWTAGDDAAGDATGHPGICEPVGSCDDGFTCGCVEDECLGR